MKWIGRGILLYKGKKISYGQNIPKDFPKKQLNKLKKDKKIGTVIEVAEPEPISVKDSVQKTDKR